MKQILKTNSSKEYEIEITDEPISEITEQIIKATEGKKRLFVICEKVYKLYSEQIKIPETDGIIILKDGEKEKNYKNYLKIIKKAIETGLTRKDVFVALGGGVTGDITGFASATYMRGAGYIQVPTTLLSAVDSSVGGKTAIDLDCAKNVIGCFYQPDKVIININFLKTLDNRQFLSGLGEVVKYGFIEENCGENVELIEFLKSNSEKILKQDNETIISMITKCLTLKTAVVNQDEKEGGLRKVLNLGHTFGHALETITKYKKYTHGEAVICGMKFITDWAYNKGYIDKNYRETFYEILSHFGLNTKIKRYNPKKLVEIMRKDKKVNGDKIVFIVPCGEKKVIEKELCVEEVLKMFD